MDAADVEQMRKRDKYSDVALSFDCRLHDHRPGCFCFIQKKDTSQSCCGLHLAFKNVNKCKVAANKLAIQKLSKTLAVKGSAAEAAAGDHIRMATFSSSNGDSLH